jgi:hypothetical protein
MARHDLLRIRSNAKLTADEVDASQALRRQGLINEDWRLAT